MTECSLPQYQEQHIVEKETKRDAEELGRVLLEVLFAADECQ